MILIALAAYALLAVFITAILCIIIPNFNTINDEKDQIITSFIIFIVVFMLLIMCGFLDGTMVHMLKA